MDDDETGAKRFGQETTMIQKQYQLRSDNKLTSCCHNLLQALCFKAYKSGMIFGLK